MKEQLMNNQNKSATFVQTKDKREYKLTRLTNQASIYIGSIDPVIVGDSVFQIELEQFIEDNQGECEVEIKVADGTV